MESAPRRWPSIARAAGRQSPAPLGANSNINVSGGTLRFNVTTGSAFVGTGDLATVTNAATLDLAGSVSALDRVIIKGQADVLNNSSAASLAGSRPIDGDSAGDNHYGIRVVVATKARLGRLAPIGS